MKEFEKDRNDCFEQPYGIGDILLWSVGHWCSLVVVYGHVPSGFPRLVETVKFDDAYKRYYHFKKSDSDTLFLMCDAALAALPNQELVAELKKIQYEIRSETFKK